MPLKIEREDQTTINLTPMIDIVFLLIIFFMVSTKFSELNEAERDVAVNVPTVTDAKALTSAPQKRVINVFEDGSITLDREQVTLQQLKSQLTAAKKQYHKVGVVIRGDAQSLYQNVASVMATCRQAEIADLNLSVQETQLR
ncbi:MAG: biopolymer transporter ExbD [Planctomycetota bacterium]